jgi:hypothetical protein
VDNDLLASAALPLAKVEQVIYTCT